MAFETGELIWKSTDHDTGPIYSVSCRPDGNMMCLGSWDSTALLVEPARGELLRKIEGQHSTSKMNTVCK